MSYDCDAIVIGAGASGLAATKELRACGLSVRCLEATDRIGGRCHTETDTFGVPFDHGGHWLHNRPTNPFVEIGHALGFDLYPMPKAYVTEGGTKGDAKLAQACDRFSNRINAAVSAGQDVSAASLFNETSDWAHTAALLHALPMGRDLDQISVQDESEGWIEENWFCREGFGAILARYHHNTKVTLNTPVRAVSVTGDGVLVRTDEGEITARAVIVTVSVGVLGADTITFDPPLDATRRAALEGITMGSYNHTALLFEPGTIEVPADTWVSYRVETSIEGSVQGGGCLCNIGGTDLCAFETAGRFSHDLEKAGTDAAAEVALDGLSRVFGNAIRANFKKAFMTTWTENPYTRGSYSGALPGCSHLRPSLKAPHAERIFFAGEATSDANRATVAGAHQEGVRAAKEAATLIVSVPS